MARKPRPIVEVVQGPLTEVELTGMQQEAFCDKSPTGVHYFLLDPGDGGDGTCTHCGKLHSEVHKGRIPRNLRKGGTRRMTTPEGMVTVKEVAAKAGVDPKTLRRILRKSFGGGGRKRYLWKKGDPEINKIVKAIKEPKVKAEPTAEESQEPAKTPEES